MNLVDAQREVREVFIGGFPGQFISGLVWLLSVSLGAWVSWQAAMWTLVLGGIFIFFALEAVSRLLGRKPSLSADNPLNPLLMQVAFTLPLMLPLVAAAFHGRPDWLYPAFMIALGVHYLPFMFLFGMWQFGLLGIVLVASGIILGIGMPASFLVAGWFGALVQLVFAFICLDAFARERRRFAN